MSEDKENTTNPFAQDQQEQLPDESETALQEQEDYKKEIEDLNNKYLRLAADFDNYRKRQMQERENLIKYGAEETLKKIIPVLDTFFRARLSVEKLEDVNAVKQSYNVCTKQLDDVLNKIGLTKIEAKGLEFDPGTMDAVMQTPTDKVEPNVVIEELQTGYKLHDKVLRPAMVNVATEEKKDEKQ